MKCKNIQDQLINYIEGNLSEEEFSAINSHLKTCKECSFELEKTKQFLDTLSKTNLEKPSPKLKENFESFLFDEIQKEENKIVPIAHKTDWNLYLRVAASILLLISAFLLGKYQSNTSSKTENSFSDISTNKKEVFALLENPSASKRILAVTKTEMYSVKDTRIIDALISKLFLDKNVNVRLAATEALAKFTSLEKVRNALIKALDTEKEPSIQIELIQILATIQEKRALNSMKQLLENEATPNYVKQELTYNIPSLL